MRSASGRTASRVCMGLLMNGTEFLARRGQCFANAFWRSATGNIMDGENIFEFHKIVKIIAEVRIDIPQLLKREVLQLALVVERQSYGFADLLMRNSKRHALAREISGCRKSIHVAGRSSFLHSLNIEFDCAHPSGYQRQYERDGFSGMEEGLLCFLQVLVVGQRQAFGSDHQSCGISDDAARLGASEFQ